MPEVVVVLAGDTVGGLKELKKVSISASSRESVLLSKVTEVSVCIVCEGMYVCVRVWHTCDVCE